MTVSVTLKRYTKLKRIFWGSLFGALSIFLLFLNFDNLLTILFKIIAGTLMCLITYGYHDIKYMFYNLLYLYMCSVILAGFLYLLDLEFSTGHNGIAFYFKGFSINYVLLIIIAPIVLYIYIWQNKKLKVRKNLYYQVVVVMKNNREFNLIGFIDTANRLKDPITKKNIIVVEKEALKNIRIRSPILVPYKGVNFTGFIKCFSPKYILINQKVFNNYMLGIYDGKFKIEGINCILNYKLMEEINV